MREDAEKFAKEDEERKAAVETRNQAEQMAYQAEKMVNENGDKIPAETKTQIETAIKDLKDALGGSDVAAIMSKQDAFMQILQTAGAAMYQQPGADAAAGAQPGAEQQKEEKKE